MDTSFIFWEGRAYPGITLCTFSLKICIIVISCLQIWYDTGTNEKQSIFTHLDTVLHWTTLCSRYIENHSTVQWLIHPQQPIQQEKSVDLNLNDEVNNIHMERYLDLRGPLQRKETHPDHISCVFSVSTFYSAILTSPSRIKQQLNWSGGKDIYALPDSIQSTDQCIAYISSLVHLSDSHHLAVPRLHVPLHQHLMLNPQVLGKLGAVGIGRDIKCLWPKTSSLPSSPSIQKPVLTCNLHGKSRVLQHEKQHMLPQESEPIPATHIKQTTIFVSVG